MLIRVFDSISEPSGSKFDLSDSLFVPFDLLLGMTIVE